MLSAIHARLQHTLKAHGFPPEERPFAPHITIGRTRATATGDDRRRLGDALLEARRSWRDVETIDVQSLTVMESVLSSRGPTYVPRQVVKLPERA
jgi:2'-5' RNA ligase